MNLDRSKLLKEVKEAFPKIEATINVQQGLLHFEVGVLYMHTQKLIKNGEREKITKSFKIAHKFYRNGDKKVNNAIGVSYVEDLEFTNTEKTCRDWAWHIFPASLKKEHIEFHGKEGTFSRQ